MSSSFYGNRRLFDSNSKSFTTSKRKNVQKELVNICQRTKISSRPRKGSSSSRSFSLRDKSRRKMNLPKNAELVKDQSRLQKSRLSKGETNYPEVDAISEQIYPKTTSKYRVGSFNKQNVIGESPPEVDYKINVHGYCGVGKSTLVHQLAHAFSAEDAFDAGKEHREEIYINSNNNSYQIKEIDVLFKGRFQDADIHIVIFSMDDEVSVKYAVDRISFLRWKCRIQSPIYIIGNKSYIMRRQSNFETNVLFIAKKLNCRYICLSSIISDGISNLKESMDKHFIDHKVNTPEKRKAFMRLIECFSSWRKR